MWGASRAASVSSWETLRAARGTAQRLERRGLGKAAGGAGKRAVVMVLMGQSSGCAACALRALRALRAAKAMRTMQAMQATCGRPSAAAQSAGASTLVW